MTSNRRELGVEFGDLDAALRDHDYPTTTRDLIEAYGDHELDLPNGSRTVEEALAPLLDAEGGDAQPVSHDSARDARQTLLTMVGSDAIGRENYSDRTPPTPAEDRRRDQQSF